MPDHMLPRRRDVNCNGNALEVVVSTLEQLDPDVDVCCTPSESGTGSPDESYIFKYGYGSDDETASRGMLVKDFSQKTVSYTHLTLPTKRIV